VAGRPPKVYGTTDRLFWHELTWQAGTEAQTEQDKLILAQSFIHT
jgi:hypothetical protein